MCTSVVGQKVQVGVCDDIWFVVSLLTTSERVVITGWTARRLTTHLLAVLQSQQTLTPC